MDPFQKENYIPCPYSKENQMNPSTMQETLLLKSILQKKKLNECSLSIPTIEKSKLILQRKLRLSHLIPNCDQWRILT